MNKYNWFLSIVIIVTMLSMIITIFIPFFNKGSIKITMDIITLSLCLLSAGLCLFGTIKFDISIKFDMSIRNFILWMVNSVLWFCGYMIDKY